MFTGPSRCAGSVQSATESILRGAELVVEQRVIYSSSGQQGQQEGSH